VAFPGSAGKTLGSQVFVGEADGDGGEEEGEKHEHHGGRRRGEET